MTRDCRCSHLFQVAYETAADDVASSTAWQVEQEPGAANRITAVVGDQVPTGDGQPVGAMRVELRPFLAGAGDVQTGGDGYQSNRAEVYARMPDAPSTTAPADWPDPLGSVRCYDFSVYLPTGFVFATDTKWIVISQWKGYRGGSPPIALEIKRTGFRIGGTRGNAGLLPNAGSLGAATTGRWHAFSVTMKHSPDPAVGWIEVALNGVVVMPRTSVATMDYSPTAPTEADPTYLKQGIYRDTSWQQTHVIYYGPTTAHIA